VTSLFRHAWRPLVGAGVGVGMLLSQAASAAPRDPSDLPGVADPVAQVAKGEDKPECLPNQTAACDVEGLPPQQPPDEESGAPPQWAGVGTSTINEVGPAKQWFRFPLVVLAADTMTAPRIGDDGRFTLESDNLLYLVSKKGSPEPFGYFPDVTVDSLAFGAIPAEVTVRISQPRDEQNLPIAWPLEFDIDGSTGAVTPGKIAGALDIEILRLKVDGIEVPLGDDCGIQRPAPLTLWTYGSKGIRDEWEWDTTGGLFDGSVDVPAFEGCGAHGDDVDPLLTSMISGPNNDIHVYTGPLACLPYWKSKDCPPPEEEVPYPTRDNPYPWPTPPAD
jgi:hypothetical protein